MRCHACRPLVLPALLVLIAAAAAVHGQPNGRVGLVGDLASAEFRGAASITAAQVRDGLLDDPIFQLASTPTAPLDEFLAVTRRQLVLGYQRAGFVAPQVDVAVGPGGTSLLVTVVEGRRLIAGDITVAGARGIDGPRLVAHLLEGDVPGRFPVKVTERSAEVLTWGDAEKAKPSIWEPGKPAPLDALAVDRLTQNVQSALLRQGFFRPKFRVEVDTAGDGRAAMVVRVTDEGPRAVIGAIDVRGAKRNAAGDVLALIGVAEGAPADFAVLQTVQQKLWDSGRFWKHTLTLTQEPGDPLRARLTIDLDEHPKVTPLGKPLTADEAAVLRCRDWVERSITEGSDIVLEAEAPGVRGKVIVNARDGWLLRLDSTGSAAAAAATRPAAATKPARQWWEGHEVAVYLTRRRSGFQDLRAGRRFESAAATSAGIKAFIRWVPNLDPREANRQNFYVSGGLTAGPASGAAKSAAAAAAGLELLLAPVCALDELYRHDGDGGAAKGDGRKVAAREAGGVLELTMGKAVVRFRADTGKLIDLNVRTEDGGTFRAAIESGAIDREMAALDAGRGAGQPKAGPIPTLAAIATHAAFAGLAVRTASTPEALDAASAAAQKLVAGPTAAFAAQWRRLDDTFYVPADPAAAARDAAAHPMAFAADAVPWVDRLSARGAWPWTVTRQGLLIAAGRTQYVSFEAGRMLSSPDVGPLGCLVISRAFNALNDPNLARLFAKRGLERLTFEQFARDCDALFAGDSLQAKLLREVLASLRDLSDAEIDSLAVVLGPGAAGVLKAVAKLERAAPEEEAAAVVGPGVQKALWESGMRELIGAALTEMSQAR